MQIVPTILLAVIVVGQPTDAPSVLDPPPERNSPRASSPSGGPSYNPLDPSTTTEEQPDYLKPPTSIDLTPPKASAATEPAPTAPAYDPLRPVRPVPPPERDDGRVRSLEDRVDRLEVIVQQHGERLDALQKSMDKITSGLHDIHGELKGMRGDMKGYANRSFSPPYTPAPTVPKPRVEDPNPVPMPSDRKRSSLPPLPEWKPYSPPGGGSGIPMTVPGDYKPAPAPVKPRQRDKVASYIPVQKYGLFTVSNHLSIPYTVRINGTLQTVNPCQSRQFSVPVDDVVTELVGYEGSRRWGRHNWHYRTAYSVPTMGIDIH